MSTGSFNCIFCTEIFESREELQVHFRKHGDPNLHASLKTGKKRAGAAGGVSTAAPAPAKQELVNCDACSEKFPTIARAITHKHKFHPDYSVKHFCPWCGKLFPIKHLFDKHIVVHGNASKPAEVLRCDECLFEFYSSAAVSYHNRSFHRADAPAPHLTGSRKYRLVNKELVQLFFCHLCGAEFINCFNLQKHVVEQHTSEDWCEPGTDVLRCPRCDAVFHSESAYVNHLSHHTSSDIYVHTLEGLPELTEFNLQTVPPIIEKMETPIPVDIGQMLSVDLDLSGSEVGQDTSNPATSSDSTSEKKAPRKAITLNQFLSMNKDVFGDVLNFQGVEEVPSQVIANQLRPKRLRPQPVIRPGTKIMSAENIQKLKQQGVMVQVKAPIKRPATVAGRVVANGLTVGKPIKIASGAMQSVQPRFSQPRPVLHKVVKPPGMRPAAPPRQVIGKPLKILPTASRAVRPALTAPVKKPAEAETSAPGPFSCFKKPKESLIPISDVPGVAELLRSEPSVSTVAPAKLNVPPIVPTPKPSVTSSAPAVKTNVTSSVPASRPDTSAPTARPVMSSALTGRLIKSTINAARPVTSTVPTTRQVTSTVPTTRQVTSAVPTPKQVTSTVPTSRQVTSTFPTVRPSISSADTANSDSNKSKKTVPLEALEKLRKQGLLIKKPKMDSDGSRESAPTSDAPCLTVKGGG